MPRCYYSSLFLFSLIYPLNSKYYQTIGSWSLALCLSIPKHLFTADRCSGAGGEGLGNDNHLRLDVDIIQERFVVV